MQPLFRVFVKSKREMVYLDGGQYDIALTFLDSNTWILKESKWVLGYEPIATSTFDILMLGIELPSGQTIFEGDLFYDDDKCLFLIQISPYMEIIIDTKDTFNTVFPLDNFLDSNGYFKHKIIGNKYENPELWKD